MSVPDRCTDGYPHLAVTCVSLVRCQVGRFWTSVSSPWLVHVPLRACTDALAASLHAITRKDKAIGILVPRHGYQWLELKTGFITHCVHLMIFAHQQILCCTYLIPQFTYQTFIILCSSAF